MKRIWNYIIFFFLLLGAFFLLGRPEVSAAAVMAGLQLCCRSVLPTLFPFFVFTELWHSLGYTQELAAWLGPTVRKLFHLPEEAAAPLILGMIGGYPIGPITASALYKNGTLSKRHASHCLFFCCNAGPAFIIGFLGGQIFQSTRAGILLLAIHWFSALLLGFLFRPKEMPILTAANRNAQPGAFLPALTGAITTAAFGILRVCGFILFFSILTFQLQSVLTGSCLPGAVLLSSLELTQGLCRLSVLPVSGEVKFILAAGLLGWGGLCVHCQSLSALADTDLPIRSYLTGKLAHGALSAILAWLTVSLNAGAYIIPTLLAVFLFLVSLLRSVKTDSGKRNEFPV